MTAMSRSPFGVNDSPFKALNLGETADSFIFCAKNLARRARWQSDSPSILWLSQLQFLTAAKVRRSRSKSARNHAGETQSASPSQLGVKLRRSRLRARPQLVARG